MMIARHRIEARFGHKQAVLDSSKRWLREIGAQIGWTEANTRIVTGSIGALESTIELEITIADLNELNVAFEKLGAIEAHKTYGTEIEPYVVSGTSRWEIFRVV